MQTAEHIIKTDVVVMKSFFFLKITLLYGRYVAVANQELGTLEVFPRENTNGQLGKLLCCVEVPHVSCVKWRNKFLR